MEKTEDGPGRGSTSDTEAGPEEKVRRVEPTEADILGEGVFLLFRWTRRQRPSATWPPTLHTRS